MCKKLFNSYTFFHLYIFILIYLNLLFGEFIDKLDVDTTLFNTDLHITSFNHVLCYLYHAISQSYDCLFGRLERVQFTVHICV